MAVGAHADDIEMNVGGTLLKYHDRGYRIIYVMSTNNMSGQVSEPVQKELGYPARPGPAAIMPLRKAEASEGAKAFGTEPIHLDYPQRHYYAPDGTQVELRYGGPRPDCVPDNVPTILTAHEDLAARKRMAALILEHDPEYIMTHGLSQVDMEHLGTCLLVTKSYWDVVEQGFSGGLLQWRDHNTLHGPHNIQWDSFIDISGYLDRKIEAISRHRCQVQDAFRPDYPIRRRSKAWGTACNVREAAEVFTIVKTCNRPVQYMDFSLEIEQHKA